MLNLNRLFCKATNRDVEIVYDFDWAPIDDDYSVVDICTCFSAEKGFCAVETCVFHPSCEVKGAKLSGADEEHFPFEETLFLEALGVDAFQISREWLTSGISPMVSDSQDYVVWITKSGDAWKKLVLLVTKINKCSLAHARMMVKSGEFILIEGRALTINEYIEQLKLIVEIEYRIEPAYMY